MIANGLFEQVNSNTDSIFLLNEEANLEIRNSSFNQISWQEEGGIIYASYQNTITSIYNSSFTNNTAVKASLFLIEDGSVIKMYDWSMVANFAITSGLIQISNNRCAEIYNSVIHQNYAMLNIIMELFNSAYNWIIDNTEIYNNKIITKEDLESEFSLAWRLFWFVPLTLKSYIMQNPSIYDYSLGSRLFELISSTLIFQNNCKIYNHYLMAKGFMSTIVISNTEIYNFTSRDNNFRIATSILNIINSSIHDISTAENTNFIYSDLDSNVNILNSSYLNTTWPLCFSISSAFKADSLILSYFQPLKEWVFVDKGREFDISNSVIDNLSSKNSTTSIKIHQSHISSILNVSISDMQQYAFVLSNSNVDEIRQLTIANTYGVSIDSWNVTSIHNSSFINNGKGMPIFYFEFWLY